MQVFDNLEINTYFQPIVSLNNGNILGFEALSRGPQASAYENPITMFNEAKNKGKMWELESLCRISALENSSKFGNEFYIFLNIDPNIINDESLYYEFSQEFLKKFNLSTENIVFEISEKNTIEDTEHFKELISKYKAKKYKIAINAAGSGYSGLKLITDINPDFIKMDINLIRDIDKDGVKYSLMKHLREFCQITNIKIIAVGIETENELNALIDIGVDYGQGYMIQKPQEDIKAINSEIISMIKMRNNKKQKLYQNRPSTVYVGNISRNSMFMSPTQLGSKALERFNKDSTLMGIPVVENEKLVGLLMRDKFFSKLGSQYGYALFVNRPISLVMDNRPLCVEYETTIEIASKLAMNRRTENLYDYIIIIKKDHYYGIVTVKDLLEKAIELEVNYAKHLNPLSGLPGNVLIEQKLKDIIENTSEFTILYIDIDNFKVYNDIYGFEHGDKMLLFLTRILNDILQDFENIFVGHIGGDDFVVITNRYDVNDICEAIISKFADRINDFYSKDHVKNKCIIAKNRHGELEKYCLVTLSIAGVTNREENYKDIYQLAEKASSIKKKCKLNWENCYMIE